MNNFEEDTIFLDKNTILDKIQELEKKVEKYKTTYNPDNDWDSAGFLWIHNQETSIENLKNQLKQLEDITNNVNQK